MIMQNTRLSVCYMHSIDVKQSQEILTVKLVSIEALNSHRVNRGYSFIPILPTCFFVTKGLHFTQIGILTFTLLIKTDK